MKLRSVRLRAVRLRTVRQGAVRLPEVRLHACDRDIEKTILQANHVSVHCTVYINREHVCAYILFLYLYKVHVLYEVK